MCCELVLKLEGVWSDDANDPGGATKYGITWKTLAVAIAAGVVPDCLIEDLTIENAKKIYHHFYWAPVRADELPAPLDLYAFDAAVNQGPAVAIKLLQKTVGVAQDGKIGPATLAAVQRAGSEASALYLSDRALRYTGTRGFDHYGRGWLKRLFILSGQGGDHVV